MLEDQERECKIVPSSVQESLLIIYFPFLLLQWPYCDGSHGEHNKQTGDNVGPVVVKKK